MKVLQIPITQLSLDPQNARKHSEKNLSAIAESLAKFGQRKPIVVHNGVVLAGNGTIEAAKSLGWTEISVVEVPMEWDLETAKAYALADNRTAELAEWDEQTLAKQLLELEDQGWSLSSLGFNPEPSEIKNIADAFSALPDTERNDATQITLTVTLAQAELIKLAINKSKKRNDFTDSDNKNSNGNGIWAICKEWLDAFSQRD